MATPSSRHCPANRNRGLWRIVPGLSLLVTAAPLLAAPVVYVVGAGCNYTSLRAALAAATSQATGSAEIHLAETSDASLGYSWNGNNSRVRIDNPAIDSISIIGGYADCTSANPTAGQVTDLTYSAATNTDANYSLLGIYNDPANPTLNVTLKNLAMYGAYDDSIGFVGWGGGLFIQGKAVVTLDNTQVSGFHAIAGGGGIALRNAPGNTDEANDPALILTHYATVSMNSAGVVGGGIAADHAQVYLDGAFVDNNTASSGGGIYLAGTRDVQSTRFGLVLSASPIGNDISGNTAGDHYDIGQGMGGGILSEYASITSESPGNGGFRTTISNNSANFGGGLYVKGSEVDSNTTPVTTVDIINAMFSRNTAVGKGGAVYLTDAVLATFSASSRDCTVTKSNGTGYYQHPSPCSYFVGNEALGLDGAGEIPRGGVIYVTDSNNDGNARSVAQFLSTWFDGNLDPNGLAAVAVANHKSQLTFDRDIFTRNTAKHADLNNDRSVLIYNHTGGVTQFVYDTVLDNNSTVRMFDIGGGYLDVTGSILWGTTSRGLPFHFVWFSSGGAVMTHNNCVLVRGYDDGTAGVPTSSGFGYGWLGPLKLGPDFAPDAFSPALDYCSDDTFPDAYGNTVHDVPGIENVASVGWDLGAVEQSDTIYANGFGTRPDF